MKTPVLICETSLVHDPCDLGGRHDVRVLVQIHWDNVRESLFLRARTEVHSFDPAAWEGFVARALRLAEPWIRDSYVHQVLWWPGDNFLPKGWFAVYCFPAGPRRVLLGVMRYLGTGGDALPCIGSTCFCENPWWQQGGDYLNYLFHLGPDGERRAA
ncbi:MAG: hypothetical protein NTV26_02295 [Caldiserica bacterium]|nr:hypothetical protein [Caldisericota bacterium]MCX6085287.1 hypothetical protein [Caldisericota bacterium]